MAVVSAVEAEDAAAWEAARGTREYWAAEFGVPPGARESYTGAVVYAATRVIRDSASVRLRAMAARCSGWRRSYRDAVAERDAAYAVLRALRRVFASAHAVMATSATDWGQHAGEAWIYSVFVGWECDGPCEEFWDRSHRCDEGLRIVAARHGWPVSRVALLRELRIAVLAARP